MSDDHASRCGIKAVEVAFRLLDALTRADSALPLKELAASAGMSASKAHRYLISLMRVGLVEQSGSSRGYQLGSAAVRMGFAAAGQSDDLGRAMRLQARLCEELGETVILSVWSSRGPTILHIEESSQPVHMTMKISAVMPTPITAAGRVFAAFLPEDAVSPAVFEQLQQAGDAGQYARVWRRLQSITGEVRRSGLARSIDEYAPGVATVAAPLFNGEGQLVAVLAVMGRTEDLDTRPGSDVCTALLRVSQGYRMRRAGAGVRARQPRNGERKPACKIRGEAIKA